MTNITKKRNNAIQDRSPSPTSSTENPTVKELQEKNAELERRLRKYKQKRKTTQTTIKPLIRPKGEAGSRKRGFILYDAMEMSKVENGPVLYDRMRDSVRKACVKVGLDLGAHYRHQDHEKLGQVFLLVRKSYPYLTTDRFPHNWAIADMVKGYIAGTRKEHHRQAREDEQERKGETANMKSKKRTRESDTDDMPRSSSSTKSGKSKKRPDSDIENPSDEDHPSSESTKRTRGKDHPSSETTARSSFSSNLVKSTKRTAAQGPRGEDHPSSEASARSSSSSNLAKSTKRTVAADPNIEEPALKRRRSTRNTNSERKQRADRYPNSLNLENDNSDNELGPSARRTLQTHVSSQLNCEDESDGEDESGGEDGRSDELSESNAD